jgi:hypothetical protein
MKVIFAFDTAIVRTTRQQQRLLPNNWVMSFIRRDIHDINYACRIPYNSVLQKSSRQFLEELSSIEQREYFLNVSNFLGAGAGRRRFCQSRSGGSNIMKQALQTRPYGGTYLSRITYPIRTVE